MSSSCYFYVERAEEVVGNENWVYIRHPCRHRRRL